MTTSLFVLLHASPMELRSCSRNCLGLQLHLTHQWLFGFSPTARDPLKQNGVCKGRSVLRSSPIALPYDHTPISQVLKAPIPYLKWSKLPLPTHGRSAGRCQQLLAKKTTWAAPFSATVLPHSSPSSVSHGVVTTASVLLFSI